jgi:curved DNA-binding protein CbpA
MIWAHNTLLMVGVIGYFSCFQVLADNPSIEQFQLNTAAEERDPFRVLGITRDPFDTLLERSKRAKRRLSIVYHPDTAKDLSDELAQRVIRAINGAHDVIEQIVAKGGSFHSREPRQAPASNPGRDSENDFFDYFQETLNRKRKEAAEAESQRKRKAEQSTTRKNKKPQPFENMFGGRSAFNSKQKENENPQKESSAKKKPKQEIRDLDAQIAKKIDSFKVKLGAIFQGKILESTLENVSYSDAQKLRIAVDAALEIFYEIEDKKISRPVGLNGFEYIRAVLDTVILSTFIFPGSSDAYSIRELSYIPHLEGLIYAEIFRLRCYDFVKDNGSDTIKIYYKQLAHKKYLEKMFYIHKILANNSMSPRKIGEYYALIHLSTILETENKLSFTVKSKSFFYEDIYFSESDSDLPRRNFFTSRINLRAFPLFKAQFDYQFFKGFLYTLFRALDSGLLTESEIKELLDFLAVFDSVFPEHRLSQYSLYALKEKIAQAVANYFANEPSQVHFYAEGVAALHEGLQKPVTVSAPGCSAAFFK